MITTQWFTGDKNLEDIHTIRRKVFIEEQNVTAEDEFDGTDAGAIHLLVRDGNQPIATGRIIIEDGVFYLGRIAVLKERRGQKYGEFVLRLLIRKAYELGGTEQRLHSQTHAIGFYEKFGFTVTSEEYMEAHIPHMNMVRYGDITGSCKYSHGLCP